MSNNVTLTGTAITAGTASDASLCRVSGYLYDIQGQPLRGYQFTLRHIHTPIVYSTNTLVLSELQTITADKTGLVTFDVYRKGKVKIELRGRILDLMRECTIPDASSATLVDIVFPYIKSVAFSTADASASVAVGSAYSYTITGTFSDGTTLDVSGQATLASSNTGVATVSSASATGVTAGSSLISVTAIDTSALDAYKEPDGDLISRLSEPSITLPSAVTLTVTG